MSTTLLLDPLDLKTIDGQFLKEERKACTPCIAHFGFPISIGQCQRPSSGCTASFDIYKSVDCDGDGILDHACSTTVNNNRWLVLSSEGCPSGWGSASRPVSKCAQAFGGIYYILPKFNNS